MQTPVQTSKPTEHAAPAGTIPGMAPVRELRPTLVRCYSRSGDDLGLARLPWPNVAAGDVLELDGGELAIVVDVVASPTADRCDVAVKVATLRNE